MSDANPAQSGDIDQIEDVEDLKQRRKLQSLLDAEESVREMRKKAKIGEREGTTAGVVGYRAAVEDYLLSLRPLIKTEDHQLWSEKQLGTLTVQPPSLREFFSDKPEQELNERGKPRFGTTYGVDSLKPKTVAEFDGLQSLLDAPSQFTAQWTIVFEPSAGGQREIPRTKRVDLPLEIIDEAFELASDFADEHGFGLDRDSGRPFNDYS